MRKTYKILHHWFADFQNLSLSFPLFLVLSLSLSLSLSLARARARAHSHSHFHTHLAITFCTYSIFLPGFFTDTPVLSSILPNWLIISNLLAPPKWLASYIFHAIFTWKILMKKSIFQISLYASTPGCHVCACVCVCVCQRRKINWGWWYARKKCLQAIS